MENPIKMDDLGVPLFSETSISAGYIAGFCGPINYVCYVCWTATFFFRSEFYLMLENSDGVTIFSAVGLQPAMAGGLQT